MRKRIYRPIARSFMAACCLLAPGLAVNSRAAVSITSTVTFNAGPGNYTYTYSVQNLAGAPEDLALITIPIAPAASVTGSAAPTGFDIQFDPSQGWINLIEDGNIVTPQTFAPGTTVAPFTYTSFLAPATVTYSAFDAAGTEYTGTVQSAFVPEPSAAGFAEAGLFLTARRRRRTVSSI